jgi:cysteine synthase A
VIVIPDTQSQEKKDLLRLQGAALIEVPAVAYSDPNNYVKLSGRLALRLAKEYPAGAIWANQFDNIANRQGHFETTGPEIWAQTARSMISLPSGLAERCGVAMALKAKTPISRSRFRSLGPPSIPTTQAAS